MQEYMAPTNRMIREVRELEKKSKVRREKQLFIAEGERLCSEIPAGRLERLFLSRDYQGKLPADVTNGGLKSSSVFRVTDETMQLISDTKTSQGILAVVRMEEEHSLTGDLFLVLETLQDPGNMGTIFRTAEAAGVSGIIMDSTCVDVYSPKVVRAAMGAIFRMPFQIVPDLKSAVSRLKADDISVYAAHLRGEKPHYSFDYRGKTAFMIGNEGNGLSDALAALATDYLRIPMMGKTESLNASIAAAVLMYEALRQRSNS